MGDVFNKIVRFSGNIERSLYWKIFIPMLLVNFFSLVYSKTSPGSGFSLVLIIRDLVTNDRVFQLMVPIFAVSVISIISLVVRRLRDINVSVWWVLPASVNVFILWIVGLILCFIPAKKRSDYL